MSVLRSVRPQAARQIGLLTALAAGLGLAAGLLAARAAETAPVLVPALRAGAARSAADAGSAASVETVLAALVELLVVTSGAGLAAWVSGHALVALGCVVAAAAGRRWVAGEHLVAWCAPAVVRRLTQAAAGAGLGLVLAAPAALALPAVGPEGGAPVPDGGVAAVEPAQVLDLGWRVAPEPPAGLRAELTDRSLPAGGGRSATVVVVPGDTLWDLAEEHLGGEPGAADVVRAVTGWHAENVVEIGPDPDLLRPGAVLRIPQG
ncbi:LysM peptidoglycan-binding domain-containing protein [Antribacter gilvus]|uniref:LysM peptidoglycan-binding domain-containing protein n=1 Tax=Antribacter gilvus TaxID=2304675 RepID=UPI0013E0DC9A|nr:LysM peptidoglycan-binding domain-containing protein [Antribacter gilvus]